MSECRFLFYSRKKKINNNNTLYIYIYRGHKQNDMRGVSIIYSSGRKYYKASFQHEGVVHKIGLFKKEREAGLAYDLYVIKNSIPRTTNFLKKKAL